MIKLIIEIFFKFFFFNFSWLIKHPGFNFKMEARDPSLLPKEFSNTSNDTCYFLDGYKHPNVDDKAPLREHIEATMMQINV